MAYEIEDAKTFDENLEVFAQDVETIDAVLGVALKSQLKALAAGSISKEQVWDVLLAAVDTPAVETSSDGEDAAADGDQK